MDRFLELRTFVQVVTPGSFIGAAEPLAIVKAGCRATWESWRHGWGSPAPPHNAQALAHRRGRCLYVEARSC